MERKMENKMEAEKSRAGSDKRFSLIEQVYQLKENEILVVPITWEG